MGIDIPLCTLSLDQQGDDSGKSRRAAGGSSYYVQSRICIAEAVDAIAIRTHEKSVVVWRSSKGQVWHVSSAVIWRAGARLPGRFRVVNTGATTARGEIIDRSRIIPDDLRDV